MALKEIKSAYSCIYYGNEAIKPLVEEINEHSKLHKAFILCDVNSFAHCLPVLVKNGLSHQLEIITTANGERNKTLDNAKIIWAKLQSKNANRYTLLINLGGGIISDLGGLLQHVIREEFPMSIFQLPSLA